MLAGIESDLFFVIRVDLAFQGYRPVVDCHIDFTKSRKMATEKKALDPDLNVIIGIVDTNSLS